MYVHVYDTGVACYYALLPCTTSGDERAKFCTSLLTCYYPPPPIESHWPKMSDKSREMRGYQYVMEAYVLHMYGTQYEFQTAPQWLLMCGHHRDTDNKQWCFEIMSVDMTFTRPSLKPHDHKVVL